MPEGLRVQLGWVNGMVQLRAKCFMWFLPFDSYILLLFIYIYTQYTRISICRTTFIFYLFLCLFLLLYLPITKSLPLICAPIFFHPPTPAVKRTWAMGQGQGEACRVLE
jgi:hypothetical protein